MLKHSFYYNKIKADKEPLMLFHWYLLYALAFSMALKINLDFLYGRGDIRWQWAQVQEPILSN